eukprot:4245867-Amphidinium_carterae.1
MSFVQPQSKASGLPVGSTSWILFRHIATPQTVMRPCAGGKLPSTRMRPGQRSMAHHIPSGTHPVMLVILVEIRLYSSVAAQASVLFVRMAYQQSLRLLLGAVLCESVLGAIRLPEAPASVQNTTSMQAECIWSISFLSLVVNGDSGLLVLFALSTNAATCRYLHGVSGAHRAGVKEGLSAEQREGDRIIGCVDCDSYAVKRVAALAVRGAQ